MQILFVAPYLPSPTRFRALRLVQGLAGLGHRVTVVALGSNQSNDEAALQTLNEYCEAVHVVPFSKSAALIQSALHVASAVPIWAASHYSSALNSILTKLVSEKQFDIGHIEHLRAAHVAGILRKHMPLVFDAVECVTEQQQEHVADTDIGSIDRMISQKDFEKLRKYEPQSAAQFDRVMTSTQQAALSLQELAAWEGLTLNIDFIPNGVDLEYFRPQHSIPILPANIVFPGQFNNQADRDAVSYFCDEIFPGIRNACPLATVTFVGGDPPASLSALASQPHSGIEVTGRVADARPYLARAAVAVCPMRLNGSRNRVLQIMAMGKALVAAAPACRSLDISTSGQSLCLADTPLSFATQIIYLIGHPEEAERLGANARAYVEQNHDWSYIVQRVAQVYDEIIASRAYVAA